VAESAKTAPLITSAERLGRRSETWFALGMVGILGVLLVPLPGAALSVLLAVNISLALLIMLAAVYTRAPLEFSSFPSLLLVTTLMRLGLNVASTRLILLTGDGGSVIETFGDFVVGGNFIVGVVVFAILLVIQMVVVTKGAGRISEVAARFVLDAMPGKQMAIDADLNAGLISEKDARTRREKIAQEAEFFGAMDGAGKFVKGDAIAGLIITLINIAAGFVIGMTMLGMSADESIKRFTLLTIGDGLVSQIPSFLITISSGLIVTKNRSDDTVGVELAREFFLKPKALAAASLLVLAVGMVPGMPFLPFAAISGLLWFLYRKVHNVEGEQAEIDKQEPDAAPKTEEKVEDLVAADRIGVEIGYRLIPLVDKERGGTLLERITTMRRQLAREQGMLIPPIRIKDNLQLPPTGYRVMLHGQTIATSDLHVDRLLAIDGGAVARPVQGMATKEPAFGLDAVWIEPSRRAEAEGLGYTVTDPASAFITHLTILLKAQSGQILNREDVQALLDSLKKEHPVLVKDIEANAKLSTIQKVLALLLEERVPLTNLEKILEAIADQPTGDPAFLAEQARGRIGRTVISPWLDAEGRLWAVILDPATEARMTQAIIQAGQGGALGISPSEASALVDRIGTAIQEAAASGHEAVLLTTAQLRRHLRGITSRFHPDLAVCSFSEIGPGIDVQVVTTVTLAEANTK
jgi:flagellar biosynthesis protein FlhA